MFVHVVTKLSSSGLFGNSEANVSEFLRNLKEMFVSGSN